MKTLQVSKRCLLTSALLLEALTTHGLGCSKFASPRTDHSSKSKQDCGSKPRAHSNYPTIDKNKAIELALKNYKQLFGELASRSEVPGEWVQLASPSKERFVVTQTPSTWELVHDGNVGLVAHAKVGKKSGLVEWTIVAIAHE